MRDHRLKVSVSFDPRRGYFTTGSELRESVTALSLGGLRRRIETAMLPDDPVVVLRLDRAARQERDRRHRGGTVSRERLWLRCPGRAVPGCALAPDPLI
jgi:hypothetical protein